MYKCPHCGAFSMHPLGIKCPACNAELEAELTIDPKIEEELNARVNTMLVSTGEIGKPYEVIGPVYFNITNKGLFSSQYKKLEKEYRVKIETWKEAGQATSVGTGFGDLVLALGVGEWSAGHNLFDKAFFIAVEELKKRAAILDADGISYLRQDIDLDTSGFQYFYLQMYGTAIKLLDK